MKSLVINNNSKGFSLTVVVALFILSISYNNYNLIISTATSSFELEQDI